MSQTAPRPAIAAATRSATIASSQIHGRMPGSATAPTSTRRSPIAEKLAELRARRGLTVILVEQNLDFIKALADHVLVIHKGRIVREVAPAALADPAIVSEFIGAA